MKVEIGNATLICADARIVLSEIMTPESVVVTDPPWDQARGIPGADDPRGLFSSVAGDLARAKCVAVQLGCYTDPTFCAPLAALMPFFHTCWLKYILPSYRGRVLVSSDVAYVYGTPPPSVPGRRVIPAEVLSNNREPEELEFNRGYGRNRGHKEALARCAELAHPMPRRLQHVRWLIEWHSTSENIIVDPFMGSGTAGVACARLGRRFIGIEVEQKYFSLACRRIEQAQRQGRLFA
jgi:hypothetical protein